MEYARGGEEMTKAIRNKYKKSLMTVGEVIDELKGYNRNCKLVISVDISGPDDENRCYAYELFGAQGDFGKETVDEVQLLVGGELND